MSFPNLVQFNQILNSEILSDMKFATVTLNMAKSRKCDIKADEHENENM